MVKTLKYAEEYFQGETERPNNGKVDELGEWQGKVSKDYRKDIPFITFNSLKSPLKWLSSPWRLVDCLFQMFNFVLKLKCREWKINIRGRNV